MDFLNTAFRQLTELFRSMTPAARITSTLLLVTIASSLMYLFRYQTDRTDEFLFGGLVATQSEIVAMEAAFGKAGLSDYEIIGNKVRVPRAQRSTYLAALAEESALPQSAESAWTSMFATDSPFDGQDTRERKARFAQEKSLTYVIGQLKDISYARVAIDEQKSSAFGARKSRQVLVAVKALGNKSLDEEQVKTIRYTVSTGAGTKPEDVTVTDLNAQIVYPGIGKEQGVSEFQNLYATYQRQYVSMYKQLILDRLSAYQGIKVGVHVELDKDVQNQTSTVKVDEKPTPTELTTVTEESSSKSGDNSGRPGAVPNGATGNQPAQVAANPANESTVTKTREDQKSLVGATQTTTQKAALSPVYVSASIGVPKSYFVKVWHLRNPTKPGEEPKVPPPDQLKQIETEKFKELEEAVVKLLPRRPPGDDVYAPVTVSSFDDIPIPEPVPPSLASNAMDWFFANWRTIGLFGLAAFGVIFLRGMVRSAQAAVPPPSEENSERSTETAELEAEEEAASSNLAVESPSGNLKKRFQSTGRSLRDELTDLVHEDPDAAANVLKLWISDAA